MDVHGLDDVIGAAQLGEEWAWSRLYEAIAPSLIGYFRVRGMGNAEDLVGETFVQLARNLHSFDGDAESFRSWVFMIAHNRLSNARRRFVRKPEILSAEPLDDGRRSPSAETAALAEIGSSEALEMLAVLTPDQRNVLALRFIADLSVSETATAIGASEGAVKQLTRRALERLRSRLPKEAVTR